MSNRESSHFKDYFFARISGRLSRWVKRYMKREGIKNYRGFLLHCAIKLGYNMNEKDVS